MYKILVVDDENIVRLAIRTILNSTDNFTIVGEAKNGNEALKMINDIDVDIVITDLKMPSMDGITLIKELKKLNYSGKILVLSNYDDYSLVRDAMKYGASDYLLKLVIEENEFLDTLNQISKQIPLNSNNSSITSTISTDNKKTAFLHRLLFESLDIDYIKNQIADCAININLDNNIILHISIDNIRSDDIKKRFINNDLLQTSIINILSNQLSNIAHEVIGLKYRDFIIIIPTDELSVNENISAHCNTIKRSISMYLNITVTIVVSNMPDCIDKLHIELKRTRSAMDYRFYCGNNSIIEINEVKFKPLNQNDYSNLIIDLKEKLRLGKIDEIISITNNLFEDALKDYINPHDFKALFSIIIENLLSILIEIGENNILYLDQVKSTLLNTESINDYQSKIKTILYDIHNRMLSITNTKYRKEIKDAIKFITNNIDKKISVKRISKEINLNENYLSRLFKSETGETIIGFINRTKINHATYLLRENNNLLIKEVAKAIGIDDQFYFIRLFKKHIGMSPSHYRNNVYTK